MTVVLTDLVTSPRNSAFTFGQKRPGLLSVIVSMLWLLTVISVVECMCLDRGLNRNLSPVGLSWLYSGLFRVWNLVNGVSDGARGLVMTS